MMKVCDDFDMCDRDENNNYNSRFIVSDGTNYYDIETGTQYKPDEQTNISNNLLTPPQSFFQKTIYYLKNLDFFCVNLWKTITTCSCYL